MEHHQTSLSDLPQDIFYYVAKYFDLLDFSAMLLTNRSMYGNLAHDLKLQHLFLENTSRKTLHSRAKIPLRTVYLEHVFLRAIKEDNSELLAFALINPSYNTVLARIKPMRAKNGLLQRQRGPVERQDVLAKIFEHDAHNVLTYIVDICLAEIELPAKFEHLVALLSLLAEYSFKDNTTSKKTVKFVMSVFKKFEDSLLFSLIYVSSLPNACWGISDVPATDLFVQLSRLQKSFPEFQYDLNKTVGSSTLRRLPPHAAEFEAQVSPLEYAAFLETREVFSVLIECGAKFDVKKPYLPIALFNKDNIRQKLSLIDYLIELGADINLPLPSYLDNYQFNILRYSFINHSIWYTEFLLAKGARSVVTDQEMDLLLNNDYYLKHRPTLALQAQISGYDLLKQNPTILPENSSLTFRNWTGSVFELKPKSEVVFHTSEHDVRQMESHRRWNSENCAYVEKSWWLLRELRLQNSQRMHRSHYTFIRCRQIVHERICTVAPWPCILRQRKNPANVPHVRSIVARLTFSI